MAKNAIKHTALKQTQSFSERKCYSSVCQTMGCEIKCCERKSSLVIEVSKNRMATRDTFSQIYPVERTEFKCRLQGRIDVHCCTCMQIHTRGNHSGVMAFCVSFGIDKRDFAIVFGLCSSILSRSQPKMWLVRKNQKKAVIIISSSDVAFSFCTWFLNL